MYYVYILKSVEDDWHYVGYTSDLRKRFKEHKQGNVKSTKNHHPLKMASYIAVEDKETAMNLEKYLKSGSGMAWRNKRLL
jgi:predicted GIY-YIG superfamily endonuclease